VKTLRLQLGQAITVVGWNGRLEKGLLRRNCAHDGAGFQADPDWREPRGGGQLLQLAGPIDSVGAGPLDMAVGDAENGQRADTSNTTTAAATHAPGPGSLLTRRAISPDSQ